MSGRVAWLAENSAEDDFLFASARFRGYIDLDPGVGEQLEDATLEDALAWAGERASVVLIRLCDSDYFSAGEENPDPESFPQWPADRIEVVPRRPRGLEALDNTEKDPPVLWDLRFTPDAAVDERVFREVLEADPRTLAVPAAHADESVDGVRVLVRVSTEEQARAIAEELSNAGHAAAEPASRSRDDFWVRGWQIYPFAQTRQ